MELDKVKKSAGESGISSYFKLKTIKVKPEQILLDPRNPRLGIDSEEFDGIDERTIVSEQAQRAVMRQIEKREHHVSDLISSIGEKGFLDGLGTFIIKKSTRSGQYLVLEGNRRAAAIKQLLKYPKELSHGVKKSLKEIAVSKFSYIPNDRFSEEQIIEMLLGIIHLQGPLPWGPMEKARYIYQAYTREYRDINGGKDFAFLQDVVKKLCSVFPLSQSEVKKNLRIYMVYRQLMEAGYEVDPDRYSLIDKACNDKVMREEYFELDDKALRFSEVGLERFNILCVDPNRPINEPKMFNKFKKIFMHIHEDWVQDILDGIYTVEELYDHVEDEIKQGELYNQLENILNMIQALRVGDISTADDECCEILERIVEVVINRLAPFAGYESASDDDFDNYEDSDLANNIQEALELPGVHLKVIIKETLRERPNKSCVKSKLVKYILDYLDILTRGEPRKLFAKKVDGVVNEMVVEGTIKEYTATNVRLKLMV